MAQQNTPWYLRTFTRGKVFRSVPIRRLWPLLLAAFFLFTVTGFYSDLVAHGTRPYAIVIMSGVLTGLDACLWIIVFARLPAVGVVAVFILQFFLGRIDTLVGRWMQAHFILRPVPAETGVYFAATGMFWASMLAYILFFRYIVQEGKQSLRIQNELELAHEIQRTLVPSLQLRTLHFDIYGISHPSERVGGDLVDAVLLPSGEVVAYLADVAGHGLPASILMGRVKTAARTALLDAGDRTPGEALPLLLDRLNTVLPQVKEPQMYATLTAFRFGADGSVFYALAASPPILHWHAGEQTVSCRQEPQLPLGLLPVSNFEGYALHACSGDLFVVATDGILEVANKQEEEFGMERLQATITQNHNDSLPELAGKILSAARAFGRQFDDQTILVVRCL
jgi:serine phosphatase RsbU (regulator of sigma subunit)